MTLSLKAILGIVTASALVMAGILATLQLPAHLSSLPLGILYAALVVLLAYAAARSVSMKQGRDRFWLGFLAVGLLCMGLGSIRAISSYSTLTAHLARTLFLTLPTIPESMIDQDSRFDLLRSFLDLVATFTMALGGGLVASRSSQRNGDESRA